VPIRVHPCAKAFGPAKTAAGPRCCRGPAFGLARTYKPSSVCAVGSRACPLTGACPGLSATATISLAARLPARSAAVYPSPAARTGRRSLRIAGTVRPCTRRGLPCLVRRRTSGGLLPHRFTLARRLPGVGGLFSVALSVGRQPVNARVAVSHRRVLPCSDFPLKPRKARGPSGRVSSPYSVVMTSF